MRKIVFCGFEEVEIIAESEDITGQSTDTVVVVDTAGFADLPTDDVTNLTGQYRVSGAVDTPAGQNLTLNDSGAILVIEPGAWLRMDTDHRFIIKDGSAFVLGTPEHETRISGPGGTETAWAGINIGWGGSGGTATLAMNGCRINSTASTLLEEDVDLGSGDVAIANSYKGFRGDTASGAVGCGRAISPVYQPPVRFPRHDPVVVRRHARRTDALVHDAG